jgi:hypothetical protein
MLLLLCCWVFERKLNGNHSRAHASLSRAEGPAALASQGIREHYTRSLAMAVTNEHCAIISAYREISAQSPLLAKNARNGAPGSIAALG